VVGPPTALGTPLPRTRATGYLAPCAGQPARKHLRSQTRHASSPFPYRSHPIGASLTHTPLPRISRLQLTVYHDANRVGYLNRKCFHLNPNPGRPAYSPSFQIATANHFLHFRRYLIWCSALKCMLSWFNQVGCPLGNVQ